MMLYLEKKSYIISGSRIIQKDTDIIDVEKFYIKLNKI
jgi:hypothetical protein